MGLRPPFGASFSQRSALMSPWAGDAGFKRAVLKVREFTLLDLGAVLTADRAARHRAARFEHGGVWQ
jgi:hypothetical protein